MTVLESIVKELQDLPTAKQVEVARYVHQLNEVGKKDRLDWLHRSYGCLSKEDGKVFEEALAGSRRMPANG